MNNGTSLITAFVIGAAAGACLSWYALKKKYERIAQKEIDSVKSTYGKREISISDEKEESKPSASVEKPDIAEYAALLHKEGYSRNYTEFATKHEEKKEKKEKKVDKPYVISPEEFGEFDEYEKISLIYYADGILADEDNELVDDADDIVGEDSLNHFGEYEEDTVFVRNDRLKCDYEIMRDERSFSDTYDIP